MNPLYHDAIERRLAVPLQEGPDKVATLAEAVRRHVQADTVYLGCDAPEADLVRAAREACGWDLQVAPTLRRFEAPTADELTLVRLFDPRRYFLGE